MVNGWLVLFAVVVYMVLWALMNRHFGINFGHTLLAWKCLFGKATPAEHEKYLEGVLKAVNKMKRLV